jgi:hypothetical protein
MQNFNFDHRNFDNVNWAKKPYQFSLESIRSQSLLKILQTLNLLSLVGQALLQNKRTIQVKE